MQAKNVRAGKTVHADQAAQKAQVSLDDFAAVQDDEVEQEAAGAANVVQSSLIDCLNEQQREIVLAPSQDMMVIAGAGTGKTHVLISRIAYLLQVEHVKPWMILAVTFTNKAAREMEERVCKYMNWDDPHNMIISTFHGFCYSRLRMYATEAMLPKSFVLLTPQDQESLLTHFLKEHKIATTKRSSRSSDKYVNVRDALGYISRQKDEGLKPKLSQKELEYYLAHIGEEDEDDDINIFSSRHVERLHEILFACYEHFRERSGAVDFGDLINKMVELLRNNPQIRGQLQHRFRYIFVDEFQDTNGMQYELLKLLKCPQNNVCVVGDDDQSIYEWRGAKIENLQKIMIDFANLHIYALTINYRSSRNVLNFSNALIRNNKSRLIDKFLVNPLTYEGLKFCEIFCLQYMYNAAKTDPQLGQFVQQDKKLAPYIDRDLSTIGVKERQYLLNYAFIQGLVPESLQQAYEQMRWGDPSTLVQKQRKAKAQVESDTGAAGTGAPLPPQLQLPKEWGQRYKEEMAQCPKVQVIAHSSAFGEEGSCIYKLVSYLHESCNIPLDEIAVLYRKNSLSSEVEQEMVRHRVKYQIFGGLKFYDRAEILAVLAYLRLLVNPRDDVAFNRVINLPKRGIGDASVNKLRAYAQSIGMSLYEAIAQIAASSDKAKQRSFKKFITFYQEMEVYKSLLDSLSLSDFIRAVVERTGLVKHFQEQDAKEKLSRVGLSRVDNIYQLITNAKNVESEIEKNAMMTLADIGAREVVADPDADGIDSDVDGAGDSNTNKANNANEVSSAEEHTETLHGVQLSPVDRLNYFLSQTCLVSGAELNSQGEDSGKGVQMMTIHASKGLEFTAVIVMGCEERIMPSPLADRIEEERRLAYVAFTRAKRYLFACYANSRYSFYFNDYEKTGPSMFLNEIGDYYENELQEEKKVRPYEKRSFIYSD